MFFSSVSVTGILLVLLFILVMRSVRVIDRRRRPLIVAQMSATDIMESTEPAFPRDHVLLRQRNDMISIQSPRASRDASAPQGAASQDLSGEATSPRGVTVPRPGRTSAPSSLGTEHWAEAHGVRRGRTAVALGATLALALGVITALLAPFTAVTWTVPVFLLLIGAGAFICLRYLALAERGVLGNAGTGSSSSSTREWIADGEYETASESQPSTEGLTARRRGEFFDRARDETPVSSRASDAEGLSGSHAAETHGEVPMIEEPGLDLESLREQARRVAAGKPAAFTPATSSWSPVEVPQPTYVSAAQAERSAPEPLQRPEQPKSTSSSLAEAASKGESNFDLDDVLSRRRA